MTKLTFYTAEICPYAQRTQILLAEKGIDHDPIEIDLDNKPDWFTKLTPTKRVPVICHDDFILWESTTVNEYLDASFPGPGLRPENDRACAVMRNEIKYFDNTYLPVLYKLLFEQDIETQDALRQQVEDNMCFLESRLEKLQGHADQGPYWMGSKITLADLTAYPFFERLPVFTHYRAVRMPSSCHRLNRWLNTMRQHPTAAASSHDLDWFIPRYTAYANGTADGLSAQAFRNGTAN